MLAHRAINWQLLLQQVVSTVQRSASSFYYSLKLATFKPRELCGPLWSSVVLSSNSQYSVKKTKLGTDSIITRNRTQLPIHHERDIITNCQSVHAESTSRQAPNPLSADVQTPTAG